MEAPCPDEQQVSQNTLNRNVYASSSWWNDRFKTEGKRTFDWYVSFKELSPILKALVLPISSRILVVGCGNSRLSLDMYKAGYKNITNIDIAESVISTMKEMAIKEEIGLEMEWIVGDATSMTNVDDQSFDLVIDKGTLDAVLCGSGYEVPNKLLQEMYRVVKNGAPVLVVTHSGPANRKFLFEWNFKPELTKIFYGSVDLSPEVNMLNIFRSIGKQKSLNEIIKDPTLFAECMNAVQKDSRQRLVIRKLKEAVAARVQEKRKQKEALLQEEGKILAEPAKEEQLFRFPGFEYLPFEKMEISVSSMTQAEAISKGIHILKEGTHAEPIESMEGSENQETQAKDSTEASEAIDESSKSQPKKKTIVKVVDSGYNPPRQDHCFVYLVYKLGS
jgi:EEF1A lysine methyltransferase 4